MERKRFLKKIHQYSIYLCIGKVPFPKLSNIQLLYQVVFFSSWVASEAHQQNLYNRHEGGSFYPGTGWAYQVGSGSGEGFCVNIPWSCGGIGDSDYLSAFEHIVMPIARQFEPDITIISAGFDAARGDPLGGCDVTPEGYAQMTFLLSSLSAGRILVVLEGGYNLRSISASAAAVMKVT